METCLDLLQKGIDGHDDTHEEISTIYNYLGMAYEDLPDINHALAMYERGKNILEQYANKTTGDYLGIAIFYNNIGHLYDYMTTDKIRACENYEKALYFYRKIGNESPHIIKALYHLGLIYADSSFEGYDLEKADMLAVDALSIAKKLFDSKHPLYVHSMYLYGKVELLLGHEQTAKEYLATAYEVYKENLSADHPKIIWLNSILTNI